MQPQFNTSVHRAARGPSLLVLAALLCCLAGCGDEEGGEELGVCESPGTVAGIQGRVVSPACNSAVPSATVTIFDELQFEITSETAGSDGRFSFTADEIGGDGRYLIRVEKGAFSGGVTDPVGVSGGTSQFQIVRLEQ